MQILLSHTGTVIEWCLTGIQMWLSIGIYLATRLLLRRFRSEEEHEIFPPLTNPSMIGSFLSFFLVL